MRTRSRSRTAPPDIVPAASLRQRLAALASLLGRGDRTLVVITLACIGLTTAAGVLQAVALKWLIDGAVQQRWELVVWATVAIFVAVGIQTPLGRLVTDLQLILAVRVGVEVDRDTLEVTAGMPGIEHLEVAEYLDQIQIVRDGGQTLMGGLFSVIDMISVAVRIVISVGLLITIHPALSVLPAFAIPSVLLVRRANRHVEDAAVAAAEATRAATQLHEAFLKPITAMEMRVSGCIDALDHRADQLWRQVGALQLNGATRSALVSAVGWTALTVGYIWALVVVAIEVRAGRATPGDIVLASQLALQLRGQALQAGTSLGQSMSALRMADRYVWLQDTAREQHDRFAGRTQAPPALHDGIRLEGVSFTYPGTDRPVLTDLNLHLPAGSTVALVGSNGAGKTSLVKLLCGLYRPDHGAILVDGIDLTTMDIEGWRSRLAAGFQDFLRLEAIARHSVGVGHPPWMNDDTRVRQAIDRAHSASLFERWPDALDTHIGKTYADGEELSGGQWQRLAIARALMRIDPLLLVLDEPTAALDPAAEHQLYERYAGAARHVSDAGGITVLVSHRFSSVRMANLIVVLEGGKATEIGTHDALLATGGTYANMFRQQQAAYQS